LHNGHVLSVNLDKIFIFEGITGEANNLIEELVNDVEITPHLPTYMDVEPTGLGAEGTTTVFIRIETDAGLESDSCLATFSTDIDEFGSIICRPTPSYLLQEGRVLHVDLDDVFEQIDDSGDVINLEDRVSHNILVTPDLPNYKMDLEYDGPPIDTTVEVVLETDTGVWSEQCPVKITNLDGKCDVPECDECVTNKDYDCFTDGKYCFDGTVSVLNPSTVEFASTIKEELSGFEYYVNLYEAIIGDFDITPTEGDEQDVFFIEGTTEENNHKGVSVMHLDIEGIDDPVRLCPELDRVNFNIGEGVEPVNSDLLITGSRSVSGYYEENGVLRSKGPFIFTAKAWLR